MNKLLITSIGRTGTVSMTEFLNQLPGVKAFHERRRLDVPFLFLSQNSNYSNLTDAYVRQRDAEIQKEDCKVYAEVNPYFRFVDEGLIHQLGWQKIMLSRHPKTYLESVYLRKLYRDVDILLDQLPDNDDPYSKHWYDLSRFEKLCWYYAKVANYMLASEARIYKFEELIKGGEALKTLVSDLGIQVPENTVYQLPKRNSSGGFSLKKIVKNMLVGKEFEPIPLDWNQLSTKEMDTYNTLCAEPAKQLGYVLQ